MRSQFSYTQAYDYRMKMECIRVESCPVVWRSYEDRVQSFKEAWERSYTTEHNLHTIKIRLYMTFIRPSYDNHTTEQDFHTTVT